jgi:dihydroorotate dehydrogenase
MALFSLTRTMYHAALRPTLFSLDAESAHERATFPLRVAHTTPFVRSMVRALYDVPNGPSLAVDVLGKHFRSPIGIAAGFDKNALYYNALGALGFAFVEVGTVTAHAQPGNDRPRLFRLPDDRAIVNRMGFNNDGAAAVAERIAQHPRDNIVLGVNLGKSKITALDAAPSDYEESARLLAPLADYLVVNVSSPNTPGLRSLQSVDALQGIVRAVRNACGKHAVSVLVKIAPDLADEDIDAIADFAWEERLGGIIATNTTIARDGLASDASHVASLGAGGLSGPPVRSRSTAVIGRVYRRTGGRVTVVGVGGVNTADDVWEKISAGASLVQVYTGFVYEGPTLAQDLAHGLRERMKREGATTVRDVVGASHG